MKGTEVPERTRTLAQVAGTMTGVRQKDNDFGAEMRKELLKEALTTGHNKVYTPDSGDESEGEGRARTILTARQPNSYKAVALTVQAALREMAQYAIPAMDAVATADATNQHANADVILPGGTVLLNNVPVSHLLWLGGTYLPEMRKSIALLPTLDPTKNWTPRLGGVYESDVVTQGSFVKDTVPLVLHPGNDRHPPQVTALEKQVHVGEYASTSLSGAIPAERKKELLDRFDLMISLIRDAAARANHTPAVEVREGEELLKFLLS